jgi:hypothetical protein
MRNAPFFALFTDPTALLRETLDSMFVQAFSGAATQLGAPNPALPAGNFQSVMVPYNVAR